MQLQIIYKPKNIYLGLIEYGPNVFAINFTNRYALRLNVISMKPLSLTFSKSTLLSQCWTIIIINFYKHTHTHKGARLAFPFFISPPWLLTTRLAQRHYHCSSISHPRSTTFLPHGQQQPPPQLFLFYCPTTLLPSCPTMLLLLAPSTSYCYHLQQSASH